MKQDINTKREREKAMVTQMIALYCRKNHHGKALCPDCAVLTEYARQRSEGRVWVFHILYFCLGVKTIPVKEAS